MLTAKHTMDETLGHEDQARHLLALLESQRDMPFVASNAGRVLQTAEVLKSFDRLLCEERPVFPDALYEALMAELDVVIAKVQCLAPSTMDA
jgi:hypothetical protein